MPAVVERAASTRDYLLGAVAVFALLLGAFVTLTLAGRDTGGLVAIGAPVLAGLLLAAKVQTVTQQQNETLAKIDRNTNGALDGRIREGVSSVLRDAGVLPAAPTVPVQRDATDPDAYAVPLD